MNDTTRELLWAMLSGAGGMNNRLAKALSAKLGDDWIGMLATHPPTGSDSQQAAYIRDNFERAVGYAIGEIITDLRE